MGLTITTSLDLKRIIQSIIIFIVLLSAMAYVLYSIIHNNQSIPIVNISTSQNRCMSVEIDGKEYDCSIWKDLDRYQTVWIDD